MVSYEEFGFVEFAPYDDWCSNPMCTSGVKTAVVYELRGGSRWRVLACCASCAAVVYADAIGDRERRLAERVELQDGYQAYLKADCDRVVRALPPWG